MVEAVLPSISLIDSLLVCPGLELSDSKGFEQILMDTVRKADQIAVLDNGVSDHIFEFGLRAKNPLIETDDHRVRYPYRTHAPQWPIC